MQDATSVKLHFGFETLVDPPGLKGFFSPSIDPGRAKTTGRQFHTMEELKTIQVKKVGQMLY